MIKRFAVRTRSGSYYYIEDHSHLFGHPTWLIFVNNKQRFIYSLDRQVDRQIFTKDIKSIEDFKGRRIFYDKEQIRHDERVGALPNTSEVVEVIHFE